MVSVIRCCHTDIKTTGRWRSGVLISFSKSISSVILTHDKKRTFSIKKRIRDNFLIATNSQLLLQKSIIAYPVNQLLNI